MQGFSVIYRNPGHWDVYAKSHRIFRIRGGPGKYLVMDETRKGKPNRVFKTVQACMSCICDELMHELIVVEGQEPQTIASWNL